MLRFILPDDSMPRTVFWDHFLAASLKADTRRPDSRELLIPAEDIAMETNWPAYGNQAAAYLRGPAHEIGEGKNVNGYLDKIVDAARHNPGKRLLVVNMHPFFRVPLFLREMPNVAIADGNLAEYERALNPRTVSFPALPVSSGVKKPAGTRRILASFQGVASHPVRSGLASIADGKTIVVNLVERSRHSGKINALKGRVDHAYERLLQNSEFAFVPRGDATFSYRLLEVMSFGCIPVILSDGWVLPFDRIVKWETFSLRFSADAVPAIPAILHSLRADEIAHRAEAVKRVYQKHFATLARIVRTLFDELDAMTPTRLTK